MNGPAAQPLVVGAILAGVLALAALLIWVYSRRAALWPAKSKDHGITVGAAKVYDNRSLSLMLEQLREQLRTLRTIDSPKVTDSIGTRQSEETRQTSITVAVGKTADAKPAADTPPKDQPAPNISERALDLLADQVNLSYDIFNLQLMLERAISDRIMTDAKRNPRVQAVVGFPISIDPRMFAAGCAAIVEVELSGVDEPAAGPGQAIANHPSLSLIALFPQEETRNASMITSRRASIGASAETSGVPITGTLQSGRASNALRRESDTVALVRPSPDPNSVRFAWEFRPTSDSPSVSPGVRQMLAVISINEPDVAAGKDYVELKVSVRSYWRNFHLGSQTLSNGSGWRTLLTKGPTGVGWAAQPNIRALLTDAIVSGLAPAEYNDIQWYRVGEETAVVIVTGKNFFSGTSVVMGGQTLDRPETGLVIKSEKSLQLTAPVSALTHEAVLNARYGPSIELKMDARHLPLFRLWKLEITPLSAGQLYVRLTLAAVKNAPFSINDIKQLPSPVLDINGRFATATLEVYQDDYQIPKNQFYVSAAVEEELVKSASGASCRLTFPFLGKDWSLHYQMYDIRAALWAARTVDGEKTKIRFGGGLFIWSGPWSVFLDEKYTQSENGPLRVVAPDLMELELPTAVASRFDRAFLAGVWGSQMIMIPSAGAPATPPQSANNAATGTL